MVVRVVVGVNSVVGGVVISGDFGVETVERVGIVVDVVCLIGAAVKR